MSVNRMVARNRSGDRRDRNTFLIELQVSLECRAEDVHSVSPRDRVKAGLVDACPKSLGEFGEVAFHRRWRVEVQLSLPAMSNPSPAEPRARRDGRRGDHDARPVARRTPPSTSPSAVAGARRARGERDGATVSEVAARSCHRAGDQSPAPAVGAAAWWRSTVTSGIAGSRAPLTPDGRAHHRAQTRRAVPTGAQGELPGPVEVSPCSWPGARYGRSTRRSCGSVPLSWPVAGRGRAR